MRISTKRYDPGWKNGRHHDVYLDGKKLDYCHTADDKVGCAWVYKRDESGKVLINHELGIAKSEILFGEIKIVKINR